MTAILLAKSVCFTVPGIPVAQPRQRHRILSAGGRTFAQNYTPSKSPVNEFKAAVKMAWQDCDEEMYSGPLVLRIVATFPRPASLTRKKKPNPRIPKISKPDADNLAKSVCDALNGLAFKDDSQVYQLTVEKWIGAEGEQARVDVVLSELPPNAPRI